MADLSGRAIGTQLALFEPAADMPAVVVHLQNLMGEAEVAKFSSWCRDGHRGMCAAYVRNMTGCDTPESQSAVEWLANQYATPQFGSSCKSLRAGNSNRDIALVGASAIS